MHDPYFATADAAQPRRRWSRRRRLITTIAASLVLVLGAGAAVAALIFKNFTDSIVRSDFALPLVEQPEEDTSEQNILIMGMDSRVDQNGEPLSDEIYEALHAGNADDGGYNANVLMLLHIPEDRSQTSVISIPRDDYVELVGAPLGVTHSKIKEAYGLAMQERMNEIAYSDEEFSDEEAYQDARRAGRQAQIETVSHFLGDVRIDHFVEMTMGGFYYVAEAVAPVTVCLNQATEDSYSGAQFTAGVQELDAEQAMSFVRQRRDTGFDGPFLTDLDRSRRQQAFLSSLATNLKQRSTLTNPKTVLALADVTQHHVALDSDFDILAFVRTAFEASKSGARFVTLPILGFETIDGASVNTVDIDEVQSVVAAVLDGSYFEPEVAADNPDALAGDKPITDGDLDETDEPNQLAEDEAPAQVPSGRGAAGEPLAVYDSWDEPILAGSLPCVN
ncbi:LCP family protein [Leucobacter chromiireducens]|uniref:LytR family transcriptional regulator n=1 Tax=Leucobacter chromiireducens subsp. chromiireducens TaxID=660067 RepID=A0ABS1SL40_9MICO|nr:LCP family protein [Leucobacter chromiireducens]MBL3688875.1 LytR family transcriptional regulator [Leucobacter chromiireducens subsp. chromiireducens]